MENQNKLYHFVGIKGSGMSSLALVLHEQGLNVQGSDIEKYFFTQRDLEKVNYEPLKLFLSKIRNMSKRNEAFTQKLKPEIISYYPFDKFFPKSGRWSAIYFLITLILLGTLVYFFTKGGFYLAPA